MIQSINKDLLPLFFCSYLKQMEICGQKKKKYGKMSDFIVYKDIKKINAPMAAYWITRKSFAELVQLKNGYPANVNKKKMDAFLVY